MGKLAIISEDTVRQIVTRHLAFDAVRAAFEAGGNRLLSPAVDGRAVQEEFFDVHYHHPSDDLSQPIEWGTH